MNDWIDRALKSFFGVDDAAAGQGTDWSLTAGYPIALSWILLFALFALLYVGWFYLREGRTRPAWKIALASLRLSLLALLVLMIIELQLSIERVVLPNIAVVVDVSASMGEADPYEDSALQARVKALLAKAELTSATRLNQAKAWLTQDDGAFFERITQNYNLEMYYVSAGLERPRLPTGAEGRDWQPLVQEIRGLPAAGQQSRLGQGVQEILEELRGREPTAIVFFTDGVTTGGAKLSEIAEFARNRGVPLYLVGLGVDKPQQDIQLGDLVVDEDVFVDDIVLFTVPVTASGYEGKKVEVILHEAGQATILAQQEVTLGPDGQPVVVKLPYRPEKTGEFEYVVEIKPDEKEATFDNNRQSRLVRVHKGKFKVLLVDALPRYEFRYLKTLLQRDQTIDLSLVLQSADREWGSVERQGLVLTVFPVSLSDLLAYDVIIFGDVNPSFLSAAIQQNLVQFVREHGRGMIVIAGPHYTPLAYRDGVLADLFPLDCRDAVIPPLNQPIASGARPVLTDFGRESPITLLGDDATESAQIWQQLPRSYWFLQGTRPKPAAWVLAEHPKLLGADGQPLAVMAFQQVGKGKVLFHATDDTWMWRYRAGDVYFARYWLQAIRFLCHWKLSADDRGLELATDRTEYELGETVRIVARSSDVRVATEGEGVSIVVEHNDVKTRLVLSESASVPNQWEGSYTPTADGRYHVWAPQAATNKTPSAVNFTVEKPPSEFARIRMDKSDLEQAASISQGKFYTLATVDGLERDLPAGHWTTVETRLPKPLWNQWYMLALFLAVLLLEWVARKVNNLV